MSFKASPAHGWLLGKSFGQILEAERATRAALLEAGLPVIDIEVGRVDAAALGVFVLLKPPAIAGDRNGHKSGGRGCGVD